MLPLLLIAGLIAIVGYAGMLRHGGATAGLLITLVAGTVLGYPFFHKDIGPIPITIDRILLATLLVAGAVWIRTGELRLPTWRRTDTAMVVLMFVLVASCILVVEGSERVPALAQLVFFYGIPCAAYFIARCTVVTPARARAILGVLTGLGLYLAVTAILETQGGAALVWPRFITQATFEEFLGRARGPLLSPIGNGIFLIACGVAMATFLDSEHRARALVLVGATLVAAAAIAMTKTRSVWLAAAAAVTILPFAYIPRRVAVAWTLLLISAAAAVGGLEWDRILSFKRDRNVSASQVKESAELRPILAAVALKMFADEPLVGCGFNQYSDAAKPYYGDRSVNLPLEKARPYIQHNVFLSLLTETGLTGLGAFVILLGLAFADSWRLVRTCRRGTAFHSLAVVSIAAWIAYVVNGMFHEVAVISMSNFLLFSLWGWTESALEYETSSSESGVESWPQPAQPLSSFPSL